MTTYSEMEEESKRIMNNNFLWIDYRDYTFKIYLDTEKITLVGQVLREGKIVSRGFESNSLNCLIEKLERQVDELNSDKKLNLLAREIIKFKNISWVNLPVKVLCKSSEEGEIFTLNGLVQEDGSIICEPMTENRSIVDWSLGK
jgi:hypothetical protein